MIRLELSVDTLEGAVAADRLGVDRIELCSAAALGGLTPGPGLLAAVLDRTTAQVHMLVRPRDGDFRYAPEEVETLVKDVAHAVSAGAAGVVVGALTATGDLDLPVLAELVAAAGGRSVTLHRAIDVCRDPLAAVENVAELGINRVLSSGQAVRAEDGIAVLAGMVRVAAGRVAVMACGGVRAANAGAIVRATGVRDLHAAPRTQLPSRGTSVVDFGAIVAFDAAQASALVAAVRA
ncbi:copper homeostasis protein CutC [Fodinicola feengrottensis]|uniref:PF03932 family protein CutC n=1 Tax=Fodinicola feengrottensis TaxID=435914 RepID=A0ABN2I3Z6_9ACTN